MALERVAELVRRAALDTGVIAALRNDPDKLREPLNLNEDDLQALHSASAFPLPTAQAVGKPRVAAVTAGSTTNKATAAADTAPGDPLLPPEGSGGGPGVATGPAGPASPQGPPPTPPAPPAPPTTPAPSAPPVPPPPARPPLPPPPSGPPTSPPGWRPPTPQPEPPPQPPGECPPPTFAPPGLEGSMAAMGGCECGQCTAIAAMVAAVSSAASVAMAAIVAMADRE